MLYSSRQSYLVMCPIKNSAKYQAYPGAPSQKPVRAMDWPGMRVSCSLFLLSIITQFFTIFIYSFSFFDAT